MPGKLRLSAQKEKAAAIANLSNTEGAYMLHGMSGDQIKEALQGAFQEAGTEGKGFEDVRAAPDTAVDKDLR